MKPLRTQLAWDDAVNRAALDEEETAPDGAGTVAGGTEPSGGTAGREAGMQWMQERQDMLFTILRFTIYDLGLRWHRNIRDGREEFEGVGCDARVRFGDM